MKEDIKSELDCNETVKKIDDFVKDNMNFLQLLYPRAFDCEYSSLIKNVKTRDNLEQLKKK